MKWLWLAVCVLLVFCNVKGQQKTDGGGQEQISDGGGQAQTTGGGGQEQKSGGGGQEQIPGGGGQEQKTGGGGQEQTSGGGGQEQKTGGGGQEQKTGGGQEQKTGGGGGEQKPGDGQEQMFGGGGGEQKLDGQEQKFGGGGGEQKPVEAKGEKTLMKGESSGQNVFKLEQKIVHLDLKGAAPKIDYFRKLLPYLKGLGATGILLEYEGMFPYSGILQHVRDAKAYKEEDIKELVKIAGESQMEIIPLIPTFGHMEFLLEEKEFFDLREIISRSDFVCPSAKRTQDILHAMIDQILTLHQGAKWVHIGSDEVFQLGKCTRCTKRKKEGKMDNDHLFLDHVSKVATYVKDKYKLQPIMWDDMLQPISKDVLTEFKIPDLVIPMIWKFNKDVRPDLNKDHWEKYISTFPNLWIASAFKGESAAAAKQSVDLKTHLDNHKNWVDLIKTYGEKTQFTGLALSGWQRSNHLSELSELIAVSIPSLTLDLLFLNNGGQVSDSLFEDATKALQCDKPLSLDWSFGKEHLQCNFPGSEIFSAVEKYEQLRGKLEQSGEKEKDSMKLEVQEVEKGVKDAFSKVYFDDTLEEWKASFLSPIKTMLGMRDSVDLPSTKGESILAPIAQKKSFHSAKAKPKKSTGSGKQKKGETKKKAEST